MIKLEKALQSGSTPAVMASAQPVGGWARRILIRRLESLSSGKIQLVEGNQMTSFGQSGGLTAAIRIHDRRFYREAMLGPVAIAEAYINGLWDCDKLLSLCRIFLQNRQELSLGNTLHAKCAGFWQRMVHRFHSNSQAGSRRNIASHYDLGNDFFRLWLDETMAYSSGVFLEESHSLRQASIEKADRVCRKLDLSSTDSVLEIGTGYGGLALHAVENHGCKVTTTTISEQQFSESQSRFQASPAGQKIRLLRQDYRHLSGKYDKIVSIEMIEAVGHRYLDDFFGKCSDLLKENGVMLLQAIVMPEKSYGRYLKSVDFLQRHVFRGGCLPSLASMLESAGRASDFRLVHVEDLAPHYARTLDFWRTSFNANLARIRELGYSDRLIRLWNYYLAYCQAAFEERHIGVLQIVLDKPECRRDPVNITRWAAQSAANLDIEPSQTTMKSTSTMNNRTSVKTTANQNGFIHGCHRNRN